MIEGQHRIDETFEVNNMQATELELCQAAINGDNAAFEVLYKRANNMILHALRRIKGHADVEDLVSMTWLRVFKKLHLFKGHAKFSTWCYRIAINEALMEMRDWRIQVTDSLEALAEESHFDLVAKPDVSNLAARDLEEMFNCLSGQIKYAMQLKAQGLEYGEIALKLGVSLGAVKSYVYRGMALLQDNFADNPARYQKWLQMGRNSNRKHVATRAKAAGV